jgi:hypothetical protein
MKEAANWDGLCSSRDCPNAEHCGVRIFQLMSEKKPRFGGGCEMSFTSRVTFGLREFLLGLDAAFGNRKHRIPSLFDTPYRKISKPADQNCMPDLFITSQAATDTIDHVATDKGVELHHTGGWHGFWKRRAALAYRHSAADHSSPRGFHASLA